MIWTHSSNNRIEYELVVIVILPKLGVGWNYMPLILVPSAAKRTATQILVVAELNERKYFLWYNPSQQGITCSKLATEAQE